MANIVLNGDFQLPLLQSGVDLQYNAMTPQQASDYIVEANDLKYVKLSGSSMTGALSCLGLTSTTGTNTLGGIVNLSGTISLNTNAALPTAYNASPNTVVPTISQLGGTNKQVATSAVYSLSTISNIKNNFA